MDISKIKNYLVKNRPEIEIITSIFGYGLSMYETIKSTKKYVEEKPEDCEPKEEVIFTAKCYAKPTVIFAVSTGLALDSHNESLKRAIAPTTAYLLTEKAYKEYADKVKAVVGKKKDEEIRGQISDDRLAQNPINQNAIIETGNGNTLFYDCATGRYFLSDINKVKQAVNEYNARLLDERCLGLNEFYELLGLESVQIGDLLGCHVTFGLLEVNYTSNLLPDDKQCITMSYAVNPISDYEGY